MPAVTDPNGQAPCTPALAPAHTPPPAEVAWAVVAESLTKTYASGAATVRAVDGISLGLQAGAFTAIVGRSGSGKSTLLHLLAGLDSASPGRVLLDGLDLGRLGDSRLTQLRRERIGFVFQAFNLIPTLSAEENIRLPLDLAGRRPDPAWWDYVIGTVGLGDRLSHRPAQLSGGEQQRVAVARAMITRPSVVFADEPTGNLDSSASGEVLALLRNATSAAAQTVVIVTHDPGVATLADRVVVLADGRIRTELPGGDYTAVATAMQEGR